MKIGIVRETYPSEHRVALVPSAIPALTKKHHDVVMETSAGLAAGYPDDAYKHVGVHVVKSRAEVFREAELLFQVRGYGSNEPEGESDLALIGKHHTLVGMHDPLTAAGRMQRLAQTGATVFALELVPRITRAQAMDVLSSMANLAGYKAVLLGANAAPRLFPMMMTAAGTVSPAKVLVLGVGVAGLQAIATAKRLGAVVEAYDIRPEVREQVVSVGGKFVDLELEAEQAGDSSGYAKAQSADFIAKQQERLAQFVRAADVVITTAAVPGRRAPTLVTAAMQKGMKHGAVIVDIAAETGGNCETTKPGQTIDVEGVTVMGPVNLASSLPYHASQLYAKNLSNFTGLLCNKEGRLELNLEDEIISATLVAKDGALVNERIKAALPAQRTA